MTNSNRTFDGKEVKTYDARFYGRGKNAIGIDWFIQTTVTGESRTAANLNLYDRYEHISALTLTEKGE